MKAKIVSVDKFTGRVEAIPRRGYRSETVIFKLGVSRPEGLKVGDAIEVKREVNNPFLVFRGLWDGK